MTRKAAKRRIEIIRQLCALSRDGWRHARPCDYLPLERELREIECSVGRGSAPRLNERSR